MTNINVLILESVAENARFALTKKIYYIFKNVFLYVLYNASLRASDRINYYKQLFINILYVLIDVIFN